jgi:hypothetical protein
LNQQVRLEKFARIVDFEPGNPELEDKSQKEVGG